MISLTVNHEAVTKGIRICQKPRPHIHLGMTADLHEGVKLNSYYFTPAPGFLDRVSLEPEKRGSDVFHVVNERRNDRAGAFVLVDIPPGGSGSTVWTAAVAGTRPCSYRGATYDGSPCPECGLTYEDAKPHPKQGEVKDWAPFPSPGVRVAHEAAGWFQGHSYAVRLITMEPGSSFRVERRGDLDEGEPRELFYAWVDGKLRFGTSPKGVVPPPPLPPAMPKPSPQLVADLTKVEAALTAVCSSFVHSTDDAKPGSFTLLDVVAYSDTREFGSSIAVTLPGGAEKASPHSLPSVVIRVLLQPDESSCWTRSFDPRNEWPAGLDERRVRNVIGTALETLCHKLKDLHDEIRAAIHVIGDPPREAN